MALRPLTADYIHKKIEPLLENGVSMLDALLHVADKEGVEVEVLASVVKSSPILTAKVLKEAKRLRLVGDGIDDGPKLFD